MITNPDNVISSLTYPQRKLLRDVAMHKFRAESMIKRGWGYVNMWKNGSGWQSRKVTRTAMRPLFDAGVIALDAGVVVPTTQGVACVKRMEELRRKHSLKNIPDNSFRRSDETGQYLMNV